MKLESVLIDVIYTNSVNHLLFSLYAGSNGLFQQFNYTSMT